MESKLDVFDPLFVTGFVLALGRDFACLFLLGVAIPVVGQVIALYVVALVILVELFFAFAISPKLQHFAPKFILLALGILPIPLLGSLAMVLSVAAQNRLVELVLTQAAIQAVAVATGGAGEALESAVVAERGAMATTEAGAVGGVGVVAEGGGATGRAAEGKLRKLGRATEKRLKEHEEDLREELEMAEGEENKEEGPSAEEMFGIKEPTDKMQELFEPEYNISPDQEESEIVARQKFEAKKRKETEERRAAEYGGSMPLPTGQTGIPRPPQREKEVELKEAA